MQSTLHPWQQHLRWHQLKNLGADALLPALASGADILALPDVPAAVLLTGCDTATVRRDTLEGGMNLGRAFVLAGSDWVLAAEGKVDDALALEVGETLAQVEGGSRAAAASLRTLQLRLRASDSVDSRAWPAFRVIVP